VLASVYLLLRSRLGLVLTAIRDDETAAHSCGVKVSQAQQLVFVVAAAGCGAAGALLIISQLNVEPAAAFSVSWSAQMIFATIIGGIGTIEGPIVGAIVFFVLQQTLASHGTWYFMILGVVAMVVAIWARRGLWGCWPTARISGSFRRATGCGTRMRAGPAGGAGHDQA
jgi:branched-chain amino acid transport system permease protein